MAHPLDYAKKTVKCQESAIQIFQISKETLKSKFLHANERIDIYPEQSTVMWINHEKAENILVSSIGYSEVEDSLVSTLNKERKKVGQ